MADERVNLKIDEGTYAGLLAVKEQHYDHTTWDGFFDAMIDEFNRAEQLQQEVIALREDTITEKEELRTIIREEIDNADV